MWPYEVVATGIVADNSSFSKRHPEIPLETVFDEPRVDIFLKTSGKKYGDLPLPCDDPLMLFNGNNVELYLPSKPTSEQDPILSMSWEEAFPFFPGIAYVPAMRGLSTRSYQLLEQGYASLGGRLYDKKEEYGSAVRPSLDGKLFPADCIDADSVRLVFAEGRADKQPIRNGGLPAYNEQVAAYQLAVRKSALLAQLP